MTSGVSGVSPHSRCKDHRRSLVTAELSFSSDMDGLRHDIGGARRDRTDDLMLAKHALSQLSYGPEEGERESGGPGKT